MNTIVCGVDGSPGARTAVRIAAAVADAIGARLMAVHVLDRLADVGAEAKEVAAGVLDDEIPDAGAVARGEIGDVAERLAAVAREEEATMIVLGSRSRGRSRTYLRARCAAELAELTDVPILIAPLQLAALAPYRARVNPTAKEVHR
ncbi:MAG TPA: universal stress protein [Gaiellaceae bacterium]|jgi:nucleotide-binding universal stress UspA family protein